MQRRLLASPAGWSGEAAVEAFAPKLAEMGYAVPAADDPSRLTDRLREAVETNAGYAPGEGYDRPLAIAMEALLTLAAKTSGADEPGVHTILAGILGLDRAHWPNLIPQLRDEVDEKPRRTLLAIFGLGRRTKGARPDVAARRTELERATGQITGVQGVEGRRAA